MFHWFYLLYFSVGTSAAIGQFRGRISLQGRQKFEAISLANNSHNSSPPFLDVYGRLT